MLLILYFSTICRFYYGSYSRRGRATSNASNIQKSYACCERMDTHLRGGVKLRGLQFANLEECENFYKSYAHFIGFNILKSSSKKTKEVVHKYKYFVCSKQGFRWSSTNVNCSRKVDYRRL